MKQILILLLISLLTSCANVVTPTGGEKDITPPLPVLILPENKTINFERESILFSFDEFIQLNNPGEQIIISPALENRPEFKVKKRNLVITFNEELKENTTYTINFGNSIRDLNEGNSIPNFTYVFSTGAYLDSATVSSTIIEAGTGQPAKDILVALYKENNDSVIFNKKPFYFTRSDPSGNFIINNIREDYYKIVAFKDQNSNNLYDRNELIGFVKESIYISDTTPNIEIRIFKEQNIGKVINIISNNYGRATLISLNTIDTTSILTSKPVMAIETNNNNDTITYWLTSPYLDSVKFFIENDVQKDTFNVNIRSLIIDSILINKSFSLSNDLINDSIKELGRAIKFGTLNPIESIEHDKITLIEDATEIIPKLTNTIRELHIDYIWKEGTDYSIVLKEGAITDIFGMINSEIKINFTTKTKSDYGTLLLKTKLKPDQNYIIQLFSGRSNDLVLQQKLISGNNTIQLENLAPGSYVVRIIEDANNNGIWDPGNYSEGKQPEKVITYPSAISIKPNWESEIEVVIE